MEEDKLELIRNLMDSRLNCCIIITKEYADKYADYLIDYVIGNKAEWLLKEEGYTEQQIEIDIMKQLENDIIIISKFYDEDLKVEKYSIESLFDEETQLFCGFDDEVTFIDEDIVRKINLNKVDGDIQIF